MEHQKDCLSKSSNFWEKITAISTLIVALGGLGALVFARYQIREIRTEAEIQIKEMQVEAQTQHLLVFIDKFRSSDEISRQKLLAEKRIDRKIERLRKLDTDNPPVELLDELLLCDNIGLLTNRGYLNEHDVWQAFGQWILYLYADSRPYLDGLSGPSDYGECRKLSENIRLIEQKENKSTYDHPGEEDLYGYYLTMTEEQTGQPTFKVRIAPKK